MPLLLICLVGLLVSVYASPVSPPMVAGSVRLANGSPVAGAEVVLFDVADLRRGRVGQATTDEAGQFALPRPTGSGALVLPREVGLGANYPNPFNPSTLIPYQLPAPSPVRLEVFNVLGQRVATLVDGEQEAGAYRARWDGTDAAGRAAAAGVYFYRLTVAGAHWTGKMVLVDGQAGVPLAGARVEAVSRAAGSTEMGRYGLVVVREGVVVHVDSDFVVASGTGSVVLDRAAGHRAGKRVASLDQGVLGDVDNNGRVELDDGLLAAMLSVDPALSLPNRGVMALGDVDCDGRVESADAALIATYVANPSDASVSARRIGQRGGYSLHPVTEVVQESITGTEKRDATVAQILDGVLVRLAGVLPMGGIYGPDHLYLGIDRAYWTEQGGKNIYEALKQRFPATPIYVAPSAGMIQHSSKVARRPTTTALRQVAPVTRFGPPISFYQAPKTALADNGKAPEVVGSITVPDAVTIGSVAVDVDITHPARSDLKVELVAPSGVVMTLYDGVQAGIKGEADLVAEGPNSTQLQGQAAQGTWQLRVGDYEPGDTGTLNAWNLTITPAQEIPATEEPVNLFLETFQEGLGAWRGSKWEAASLPLPKTTVPGEGPGNVVAKAGTGCRVCFLTLETPVDLSAHDSVTLSFYRYLDRDMGNDEFLGVDIGNHGSYQRLQTWNGPHADGQWHLETFTLSGDQISDAFSLRFFGITNNDFSTIAIDNIMITAVAGSVVVEPIPTENIPDLAVTSVRATPTTVKAGKRILLRAMVANSHAPDGTHTISFYRHNQETNDPQRDATSLTSTEKDLEMNTARSVSTSIIAPETPGTYYFYACINEIPEENTKNNCASVTVMVATEEDTPAVPATEVDGISITLTPSKTEVTPGDVLDLTVTVTNKRDTRIPSPRITFYRHEQETDMPREGGYLFITINSGGIDPRKSREYTTEDDYITLPQVSDTYYYYACVNDICSVAAPVLVIDPAMTVTAIATPSIVKPGDNVTITATVSNTKITENSATISVYQRIDGSVSTDPITATPLTLAPHESVTITSTIKTPVVTRRTVIEYIVCIDTADLPCYRRHDLEGRVLVVVQPETPRYPYVDTCPPIRTNPIMGGDALSVARLADSRFTNSCRGTITLGGVEDVHGVRGFITAAHVASISSYWSEIGAAMAHGVHNGRAIHFLGKVFKFSPTFREGEGRIIDTKFKDYLADAAFVAYPKDANTDTYVDRLAPLKIRGEGDTVYTVIGSGEITEDDVPVWVSGSRTGVTKHIGRKGEILTTISNMRHEDESYGYSYGSLYLTPLGGEVTIPGDSGSPVYTNPDENNNVYILGSFKGGSTAGDEVTYYSDHSGISPVDESKYIEISFYSSWKRIVESFDLKSIGKSTRLATATAALSSAQ